MQLQLRVVMATAAAAALTGGLLVAGTGSAAAAPSGLKGDFNGDGYRDLAVSAAGAAVNGRTGAGSVTILYGSAAGAGAERIQTISQNSAGVPGSAEKDDRFGGHTAAGDFNGDGYSDLAVGAWGEDAGTDVDGGTVAVLWGGAGGLSGGTTVSDPTRSSHDRFGLILAAGDYDGNGTTDLAVASDIEKIDVFRGGDTLTSRYTVTTPVLRIKGPDIFNLTPGNVNDDGRTDLVVDGYEGDSTGDYSYNSNYYLPGSASGLTTTGQKKLPAGIVSDVGDVNADGFGDIAIGNHWDAAADSVGVYKGGGVHVLYGGPSGPDASDYMSLGQNSEGVPGGNESGDGFGWELSFGDVNGDGRDDLAIGAPGEDLNGVTDVGMVSVLYATESGFAASGNQAFEQQTAGVPGTGEAGDGFGAEVYLSDINGDGKADLTVGVPWENNNDGQVVAFTSDGSKISPSGRSIGLGASGVSATGAPIFGHHITG